MQSSTWVVMNVGLRYLPPAGGGWEGGTARTVCAPRLLVLLGFPPPASPRWGKVQDRGHVAVMFLLREQVFYSQ